MNTEDDAGLARVLDTLEIPREPANANKVSACSLSPYFGGLNTTARGARDGQQEDTLPAGSAPYNMINMATPSLSSAAPVYVPETGYDYRAQWVSNPPEAEGQGNINANHAEHAGIVTTFPSGAENLQVDSDTESDEEDEAENSVLEQLSYRIGTLKLAGDGHLRYYGPTSNLNLVDDVSASQQSQLPDSRTVRQDGQDVLNHLQIGKPVDQALEDHLVELYFTWQNPSAYVVDKEMYRIARSKWRDERNDTPFYSEVLTNAMYDMICGSPATIEGKKKKKKEEILILSCAGVLLEVLLKLAITLRLLRSQNRLQSSLRTGQRRYLRSSWTRHVLPRFKHLLFLAGTKVLLIEMRVVGCIVVSRRSI